MTFPPMLLLGEGAAPSPPCGTVTAPPSLAFTGLDVVQTRPGLVGLPW